MRLFSTLLLVVSLCAATDAITGEAEGSSAFPRIPADLDFEDGIIFKEVNGESLDLMLFRPAEKKYAKSPLVIYIHGGGWAGGDKYKVLRRGIIDVIRNLTQAGFTCASIEYRLADGNPTTATEAVADCKDAVRYFVKNSRAYGIDPDRIGTFGSSAGGHLTLVTALGKDADYPCDPAFDSPRKGNIRCVAAYYPLVSFHDKSMMTVGNFRRPQRLISLLGGPLEENLALAKKLSPLDLLRKNSPAIFLAHGDKDAVLSVDNSIALRDAAKEKGVPVECIVSHGAGHGFSGDAIDPGVDEISKKTAAFFLKYLTP